MLSDQGTIAAGCNDCKEALVSAFVERSDRMCGLVAEGPQAIVALVRAMRAEFELLKQML